MPTFAKLSQTFAKLSQTTLSRDEAAWTRHLDRFAVLVEEGLLTERQHAYSLTPRGMFFSDSIAGLLAESRLPRRRRHGVYNDNSQGFM